ERGGPEQQADPEQHQCCGRGAGPLTGHPGNERCPRGDGDHDGAVTPPRSLVLLVALQLLDPGVGGRAHAPVSRGQQPGTVQAASTLGASSSTARVTSTTAVIAAARWGSASSYRVWRPSGSATTMPQSRRQVRWFETFDRVRPRSRASTAG